VLLDGRDINSRPAKEVARRLGLLPQTSIAPDGITVAELVARGRFPHQKLIRQWTATDEAAVVAAMAATGVTDLSGELVDTLSGGQRQRVWVAMVLAQQTPIMLLDEPTTFLDIAHQIELLELCVRLNREQGTTMVAVLHDLNQASRYADHIVVMKAGRIVEQGDPRTVVTAELIEEVFGLGCRIIDDPETGTPLVIPRSGIVRLGSSAARTTAASSTGRYPLTRTLPSNGVDRVNARRRWARRSSRRRAASRSASARSGSTCSRIRAPARRNGDGASWPAHPTRVSSALATISAPASAGRSSRPSAIASTCRVCTSPALNARSSK
jgi:ABC-type cobalamin/Fe3+-siderophores transport system ATPase subunit